MVALWPNENRHPNRRLGFSLIELLVVASIIILLSSILLSSLELERRKARDVVRKNDLRNIQNTLELYAVANGVYPEDLNEIVGPNYLFGLPFDSSSGDPYYYINCGISCFQLWAELETPNTDGWCWFSDPAGRREAACL